MSDLRECGKEVNCQGERFISSEALSAVKPFCMYTWILMSYFVYYLNNVHIFRAQIFAKHFNSKNVCRNILCIYEHTYVPILDIV